MKYVVALLLFLNTQLVFGFNFNDYQKQCYNIKGEEVQLQIGSIEGVAFALLDSQTKKPIILINMILVSKLSKSAFKLIYFHECGHHVLDHIQPDKILILRNETKLTMEHHADCYAVKRLVDENGKAELIKSLNELQTYRINNKTRNNQIMSCLK